MDRLTDCEAEAAWYELASKLIPEAERALELSRARFYARKVELADNIHQQPVLYGLRADYQDALRVLKELRVREARLQEDVYWRRIARTEAKAQLALDQRKSEQARLDLARGRSDAAR
jgi:hypothetical protein